MGPHRMDLTRASRRFVSPQLTGDYGPIEQWITEIYQNTRACGEQLWRVTVWGKQDQISVTLTYSSYLLETIRGVVSHVGADEVVLDWCGHA